VVRDTGKVLLEPIDLKLLDNHNWKTVESHELKEDTLYAIMYEKPLID
jgi:hypothetical protein